MKVAWAIVASAATIASVSTNAISAPFDPFAGPKTSTVLLEQNPWLMVIGSDTPRVAIYEDGTLIFLKKDGESYVHHEAKLSASERQALEHKWSTIFDTKLERHYELSSWTDQPTTWLYLNAGKRTVATAAYGLSCKGYHRDVSREHNEPPTIFFETVEALCKLDVVASHVWTPKYVEVMLWPYEYAPDASISWPAEWPSLSSDRALKRGDSYSIFLDGTELQKLRAFLTTQKEHGAVLLAGKKWAASYRYVFPGDKEWRKAFVAPKEGNPE